MKALTLMLLMKMSLVSLTKIEITTMFEKPNPITLFHSSFNHQDPLFLKNNNNNKQPKISDNSNWKEEFGFLEEGRKKKEEGGIQIQIVTENSDRERKEEGRRKNREGSDMGGSL